ncbi:MAG: hypothetical protein K6B28_07260 [Lachnospiraceae bacterium]|nr:hypothetical protein [Lachnospiraceae bacterium]
MYNPYDNEEENRNSMKKMTVYGIATASLIVLLFLLLLYYNSKEKQEAELVQRKAEEERIEEIREEEEALAKLEIGKKNIRSEDLDFWDMYDKEDKSVAEDDTTETQSYKDIKKTDEVDDKNILKDQTADDGYDDKTGEISGTGGAIRRPDDLQNNTDEALREDITGPDDTAAEAEETNEEDKYNDGDHIAVKDSDGNTIYYEIDPDLSKNEYTFASNLSVDEDDRLIYDDGDTESLTGVLVSKGSGIVDYAKVKNDDIDYVMVKVAQRDADTGVISLDETFITNSTGANVAGLPVGAVFSTQAVNETEAVEEANFTVAAIAQYGIRYPVALHVDMSDEDARSYDLKIRERTKYVKKYLDTVAAFGFKPMIYADKNTLIAGLDLSKLSDYPILLTDIIDVDDSKNEAYKQNNTDESSNRSNTAISVSDSSSGNKSENGNNKAKTDDAAGSDKSSSSSVTIKKAGSTSNEKNSSTSSTTKKGEEEEADLSEAEPRKNTKETVSLKSWYTDFPYEFMMWNYSDEGNVDGINGDADIIIGFEDYS